jgi:probable HAF family extracellular repeat protein
LVAGERITTGHRIDQAERRFFMTRVLFRFQLVVVLATSAFYAQAQAVHYTVTDLGLTGHTAGPLAIMNNGLFADSVAVSSAWHATISLLGETQIDLAKTGGLGGPNSSALSVNEWGQAVGEAETANLDPNQEDFCGFGDQHGCQAFLWQNGVMSALAPLKDSNGVPGLNATAKGINRLGEVAGMAENTTLDSTCPPYNPSPTALQFQKYQFEPVIWANGKIQELPTSGGAFFVNSFSDPDGIAFAINSSGQAVGSTGTCSGLTNIGTYLYGRHATLWQNGSAIDLGNLGGIAPNFGNFAYGINRSGHVVGTSGTADGSFHAFFWSPETLIQDLGTLPGDTASVGLGISDLGDVGGVSFPADPNASPRAFIRPDGGTIVDLNSLIPADSPLYLFSACSINSRGEIIGLALDSQGNFHGYLATPANGPANPSAQLSAATRASHFEYAWNLLRDRLGSFGARLH